MYDILNHEALDDKTIIETLNTLRDDCNSCYKCDLGKTRTKSVFSSGNPSAKLMLIGEAPGQQEDEQGIPFVGRAGKLLSQLLENEGISRENDIYICNTVKCRPPNNRVPSQSEKAACRSYLDAQISLIRPKLILLTGATSVASFLKTKLTITKIRGELFDGPFESKMMPIFHPSYLLRNPSQEEGKPKWLMLQDLKKAKNLLNEL
ncbi:MAG: uracil-DNA glycosylase [bacterium]